MQQLSTISVINPSILIRLVFFILRFFNITDVMLNADTMKPPVTFSLRISTTITAVIQNERNAKEEMRNKISSNKTKLEKKQLQIN